VDGMKETLSNVTKVILALVIGGVSALITMAFSPAKPYIIFVFFIIYTSFFLVLVYFITKIQKKEVG
jgi:hypothetical protein